MQQDIAIIYKDADVLIVKKPVGMPSQPDPTGARDALTAASEALSAMGESGEVYLVHRLDRTVGGLIAFARTKAAAAALCALVSGEGIGKIYLAVCHGRPKEGRLTDFIYKDSAAKKAYCVKSERKGAKAAALNLAVLAERDGMSLVAVRLETGRFHQIRVQLASRANPLVGDKKYGSRDTKVRTPSLFASRLDFKLFGKEIKADELPPTDEYPWSLFDIKGMECLYGGLL